MSEEKKPESQGPIVIRKGQVGPLPGTEAPSAPTEQQAEAKPDNRPLWQRVADQRTGAQRPGGSGAGGTGAGGPRRGGFDRGGPGRGGPGRGGERGGPGRGGSSSGGSGRGDRGPRSGREGGPPRSAGAGDAYRPPESGPAAMPAGEPPPMPEVAAPDEGSFADLLAETGGGAPRQRFKVGDKVAGKIIQLGNDVAFLELGSGVAEGMIEVAELQDDDGNVAARVGDIIDGVVVHASERGVIVSKGRAASRAHRDREALIEAAQTGLPVEGVVKAANKGGLEVEVMGQRAFCPMSQIDVRFVGDPATFVNQKLQFKVQRADQRDVVLSRRALLEEERAARARETREKIVEGAVLDGTVTSVQDYGAFVDLGGIEGLVHVSELAWDRVSKPQDLLASGDAVRVQVLKIEQDAKKGERISLSVRALTEKPAEPEKPAAAPRPAPPPRPRVGDVVKASVDKIEQFGVFVRFAGGRGLVPAAETGTPRGADLRKAFKVGDEVTCLVTAIDEQGRIRLSKTEAEAAEERREAAEYMRVQPRAGGKGFGTLGDLLRDKLKR